MLTYSCYLCKQIEMPRATLSSPAESKKSQRDKAYHSLRRMLILQRIAEGERLREPAWAKQLNVNRMALREAFARLEAEGLIERGPKTGYFVPRLTDADMREILEVRATLEATAAERIIREKRHSRRHLQPLQQAIDQFQALIHNGYLLGASEADRRFHERLVELGGNRRLTMIYQRAPLPMMHRSFVDTPRWEPEMRRTLEEHRTILKLILQGKSRQAQAAICNHLSDRYLRANG